MTEESQRWLEAARKVKENYDEKIASSGCGHEFLKIEKVLWPNFEKMDI